MIEAYPSNHLDSFRSLTNPKFIFLDEADMFRKGEQEDVRHVSECYIGKSDPFIVMVITPAGPGSLFYKIEAEPRRHLHLQTPQVGLHLWIRKDIHRGRDRASQTFTVI